MELDELLMVVAVVHVADSADALVDWCRPAVVLVQGKGNTLRTDTVEVIVVCRR